MFSRKEFDAKFDLAIVELQGAEKITKAILSDLSRLLLEQVHFDGDIQPVNRLLNVLTPVNRRACVLFFQHFTAHHYDEKLATFGKKVKSLGVEKQLLAKDFLEDPHNNLWSWAGRHIEMEAKPFELLKVTKFIEGALKKAAKNGMSQADFIKAILAGGLEVGALLEVLKADEKQPV